LSSGRQQSPFGRQSARAGAAITGLPAEIGDALTTHPDVGKIGFTGSIPSARHIMANAAQTIKGVTLELGTIIPCAR
jgi:acyl-CoA reductase-like NAD-dependent aldehyde dehydrogenase